MSITNDTQQQLVKLVVGMFDAAPGHAILTDLAEASLAGSSTADLANHLAATAEFKELYPAFLTSEQYATRLVDSLVGDLVSTDLKDWAVDQLTGALNAGSTRGEVALAAINAVDAAPHDDADWGDAAAAFDNKAEVASYFSIEKLQNGSSLEELQDVIANVDETDASVDDAKDSIDNGEGPSGGFFLTADQDVMTGTGVSDTFIADVLQVGGRQVNSLGTGDRLNGTGGEDSLEAQVTEGASFGDGNSPIQARTTSVENIYLEALNTDIGAGGGNENSDVYINAEDMTGLQEVWSDYSDANLIIQNLTTKTDAGEYRNTSDITIGMRQTTNSDSAWSESDMKVYFDQNFLLADQESTTSPSEAYYWLLDQDSADYVNNPLDSIDRDGIIFSLDGVQKVIRPADELALTANTWEEYAQILRDEIAAMVADGDTSLSGIQVTVDETNINQTYNDNGDLVTIPAITLTDSNGGEFTSLGYTIPEDVSDGFNVYGRFDTDQSETAVTEAIISNIVLEKVGQGGAGGELVVGGMDKGDDTNEFNGKTGVEQFNVVVNGADHLPSSLKGLRSTNNSLKVVNISSENGGADTYASLTIGNEQTPAGTYALKDVSVLNAADFSGDLSVEAGLTEESIAKYFDMNDAQGDAAADNLFFDYSLTGMGNNTLDLDVSQEVSSHEDFVLTVLSGSGNDDISVSLDSSTGSLTNNWYANQSALDNVSIATGDGDDVIRKPGSGDVSIDAGAGDDTAYTDNSGKQEIANAPAADAIIPDGTMVNAHWVTNAVNTNIHDLEGAGAGDDFFMVDGTLTVTLSGASADLLATTNATAGGVTIGAAAEDDNGFEVTVDIPTDNNVGNNTHINQAIKDAINNDPVMSKLLVAKDGPNNSVVIESLIDGEFSADDLAITIDTPSYSGLNASQQSNIADAYGDFMNDSSLTFADFQAGVAGQVNNVNNNYQGLGGSTLATDGDFTPAVVAVDEVQTIDFSGFGVTTGGSFDVGGVTVNVAANDTANDIALAVETAINGAAGILPDIGNAVAATVVVSGAEVEITFDSADGNVNQVEIDNVAGGLVVEENLVATGEEQEIDFGPLGAATTTGNFSVGGVLVNVQAGDSAATVASKTVTAINNAGTMTNPLGTVSAAIDGGNPENVVVTFDPADGDVADIVLADGSSPVVTDGAPANGTQTEAYDPFGSGDPADITDAPITTDAEGQTAAPAAGVGAAITGEDSEAETDNTIEMGTGDDVVVLSTSDEANETLVWEGFGNGTDTIVNFNDDGASLDMLDFTAYLTSQTSDSGSTESQVRVDTSLDANSDVTANEVVVTDFATLPTASGVSWGNLSAASLQAALNADNTYQVGNTADLVGSNQKAVIMIENGANDGEYKIFELSLTNPTGTSNDGFTVTGLIGVADFGDTLTNAADAMFA